MSDPRVMELLEDILESGRTPEEVCVDCPELLWEVRETLRRCQGVDAELDAIFPPSRTVPAGEGRLATDLPVDLPDIPGYEVESVLGRGGMGVVYKAQHLALNRTVALKMILSGAFAGPDELSRFRREAEAVASLRHPHIVQVYDVGDLAGRPYFTMEFVGGGSLAQMLGGVPQPAAEAAQLAATLADAVQAAHGGGIVHRDLKPANILLRGDGTPAIADFGLARNVGGESAAAITLSGARVGTPSYMAPEQAAGKAGAIGPATDVYALGAILYELLTGRPPFRGETASDTERQVISEEPVPPRRLNARVPRDLETICLKCLSKDPRRRYPSAAALADDLGRFTRGEPITARRTRRVERASKWVRRRPAMAALWAAGALFLLAAGGAALWWASDRAAIARGVADELREAARLQREAKWVEAEAALYRAGLWLGDRRLGDLPARLERARRDAAVASRLDEIRATHFIRADGKEPAREYEEYEALFRELGLGDYQTQPEVVAARVLASDIREALVGALYEWMRCFPHYDEVRQGWLRAVALSVERELKPETADWRQRAFDVGAWRDPAAAAALESDPAFDRQRVELLLVVEVWVSLAGRSPATYLLRVQRAHPGDFWANLAAADALGWESRQTGQKFPDAVRYAQAAVALRPGAAIARVRLADALAGEGRADDAVAELREALRLNPGVPYLRHALASKLADARQFADAVPALEATLREFPNDTPDRVKLATSLEELGRVDEAVQQYQEAIRRFHELAQWEKDFRKFGDSPAALQVAQTRLRAALMRQGRWDAALDAWRAHLDLSPPPPFAERVWAGYPECCVFRGRDEEYHRVCQWMLDQAEGGTDPRVWEVVGRACLLMPPPESDLRRATALIDRALAAEGPRGQWRQYFLVARALADYRAGRYEAALANAEGEAAGVQWPLPPLVASMARWRLGQSVEARAALARAILMFDWSPAEATYADAWMYHVLRREAETLILPNLTAFLAGTYRPTDHAERLCLLGVCQARDLHLSTARLYADAFDAAPDLAADLPGGHRYRAARTAAAAGCGVGPAAADLNDAERARWRKQARDWLRADLTLCRKRLDGASAGDRAEMAARLTQWQSDPILAGLREPDETAKLTRDERDDADGLWAEVGAMLERARTEGRAP